MMRIPRKSLTILSVALLIGGVTGCSDKDDDSDNAARMAATEGVESPNAEANEAMGEASEESGEALAAEAKVSEATARATALAQVPGGTVEDFELEREGGNLLYSYDIKTAGKGGIDEVQIDAITGKLLSNVHETPADEAKEAAEGS